MLTTTIYKKTNLNLCEMIYLDIISQKKPSYGGFNNFVLLQDSDTSKK